MDIPKDLQHNCSPSSLRLPKIWRSQCSGEETLALPIVSQMPLGKFMLTFLDLWVLIYKRIVMTVHTTQSSDDIQQDHECKECSTVSARGHAH